MEPTDGTVPLPQRCFREGHCDLPLSTGVPATGAPSKAVQTRVTHNGTISAQEKACLRPLHTQQDAGHRLILSGLKCPVGADEGSLLPLSSVPPKGEPTKLRLKGKPGQNLLLFQCGKKMSLVCPI